MKSFISITHPKIINIAHVARNIQLTIKVGSANGKRVIIVKTIVDMIMNIGVMFIQA